MRVAALMMGLTLAAAQAVLGGTVYSENFEGATNGQWVTEGPISWGSDYGNVKVTADTPFGGLAIDGSTISPASGTAAVRKTFAQPWAGSARYTLTFNAVANTQYINETYYYPGNSMFGFFSSILDGEGRSGWCGGWNYVSTSTWEFYGTGLNSGADVYCSLAATDVVVTGTVVVDLQTNKFWGTLSNGTDTITTEQFDITNPADALKLNSVLLFLDYRGVQSADFDLDNVAVTETRQPVPVTVQGTVVLQQYQGDVATVTPRIVFTPLGAGDPIVRYGRLDSNGAFSVDNVMEGSYRVTVSGGSWLSTVIPSVTIEGNPYDLGTIELKGADNNGDDQVSFEDFAILQNTYGRHGPILVPHVVDGVFSPGEWGTLCSDPVGDTSGDVELIRWGAEVRDGVLYAAFELDPNGPTVAQYNDPDNGKNIWLSLWLDVDPAADPATGVPAGDSQFSPRTQDIYIELGTDNGTLEGSHGWHSLNFWGDGNSFANAMPVNGTFAYSDYVVEFSCPVSAILAELPRTDGTVPASVWKMAARAAGQGFGGDYSGDITDLKSLWVSDGQDATPQANPLVPAAAATGGCGALGAVLILMVGLAMAWWNRE